MVSPLRLEDPGVNRAYVALAGQKTLDVSAVDALVGAARRDDGKLDPVERRDLLAVLDGNIDAFSPEARSRLQAAIGAVATGERGAPYALGAPPHEPLAALAKPGSARPSFDPAETARTLQALAMGRSKPTPADATRVAPRPAPVVAPEPAPEVFIGGVRPPGLRGFSEAQRRALAQRPAQELRSASPGDLERARVAARRRDADARAQAATNAMANLDPFAAQVNGHWQSPGGNWVKVGPSPLEATAQYMFAGSVPGRVLGALGATQSVLHAVQEPTAGNVAGAVLAVGLTGSAEWAKAVHSPVKPMLTATKATKNSIPKRDEDR
jgi:hypothetical protein